MAGSLRSQARMPRPHIPDDDKRTPDNAKEMDLGIALVVLEDHDMLEEADELRRRAVA